MKILFCLLLLTLVGCLKTPTPNELLFSSKETREAERLRNMENLRILEAQELRIFEQEKKQSWETIVEDANQSYKSIEHLINKKCSACHDSRVRLPFYGRIFPRINPITAHQVDGLRDLDFGKKFPLNAVGKVDQIALLTAIKNSVLDKTMPLKSYTFIYRKRKLNSHDQKLFLEWIDPLVEEIKNHQDKYQADVDDGSQKYLARKIFVAKCFRCHANGANKGNFGDMEKMSNLIKTKYINIQNPNHSILYKIIRSGEMPTSARERLSEEEVQQVLDWINEEVLKSI